MSYSNNLVSVFFLFTLFLLPTKNALPQKIQFKLYGVNSCSDSVETITFYNLTNGNNRFFPDEFGVCHLKDTGHYVAHTLSDSIPYHISKWDLYVDTVILESLYECGSLHVFYGYCYCGEKSEGYKIDYYYNGNKKVEGNFRKGRPIGRLTFYHIDGRIRKIEVYDKKGRFRRTKMITI